MPFSPPPNIWAPSSFQIYLLIIWGCFYLLWYMCNVSLRDAISVTKRIRICTYSCNRGCIYDKGVCTDVAEVSKYSPHGFYVGLCPFLQDLCKHTAEHRRAWLSYSLLKTTFYNIVASIFTSLIHIKLGILSNVHCRTHGAGSLFFWMKAR